MPNLTTCAVSAKMLLLAGQLHKARIHARAAQGQQNEMPPRPYVTERHGSPNFYMGTSARKFLVTCRFLAAREPGIGSL